MTPADLSVIVCSRDRAEMLTSALSALAVVLQSGVEVVVVDSASTTADTGDAAAGAGRRVIRVDRPGLSIARNVGVAGTTRPLLAFTDDDCEPSPGWSEAILDAFTDPTVGVVTGRLLADGPGDQIVADEGSVAFRFGAGVDPARVGAGACMAFRRSALESVGGFDEAMGAGAALRSAEDHDAIWRVVRAGWGGTYQPDLVVRHRHWRSRREIVRAQWASGLGAGALAVKIARMDPYFGWALLRRRLIHDGVGRAAGAAARGWEHAALGSALYTAGVAAGAARTLKRPLAEGHLA